MTKVRIGVVGGGISGLAAAWFLRRSFGPDAQIIVFEKKPDIGGHLRVSDVAGVPVDEGAESLLARRPEAVDLAADAGLADDIVHPAAVGAGLWSGDRIWPMPTGTVMGVPADPARLAGLLSPAEVATARAADAESAGLPLEHDIAIGRLVRSRFGAAVADRLVEPLLGGVYAGRADELSLDATVPALAAAARTHTSLAAAVAAAARPPDPDGAPAPVFAGLRGGVGRLPGAVAAAAGADVRTGVTVRSLERRPDGWRLIIGPVPAPAAVDVDAVVVAAPASAAARLLGPVVPAAGTELAGIESASMAIVTLAVPAAGFGQPPWSSGFLVPPVDGRAVKAVTYSSVKWPWLGSRTGDLVLLRASLGRHREVAQLQRDDAELVAAVRADLHAAVGFSGDIVDARVTRWGGALPQYAVGHLDRVARVRAAVADVPGLAVCGAVYDGVGVAACIGSARDAAARVVADLSERRVRIDS